MRLLCVLFVHKQIDEVPTASWFQETAKILDECRCPIVQIIHDDKGTHMIAAVGLYHAENFPAAVGIQTARRLQDQRTGSVVGAAVGQVFCGIVGSDRCCRWDITGGTVVRAARLMQHASANNIPVVLDESIYQMTDDESQLEPLDGGKPITVKGSSESITIYTTAKVTVSATTGIMNGRFASENLHRRQREVLINDFILSKYQRGVALVTGPVGSGRKTMITLALESCGINFTSHVSSRDKTALSLVFSIADWFSHHFEVPLAELAREACENLKANRITQTLHLVHKLIRHFIVRGHVLCVVVSYCHLLDPASIDFIKSVVSCEPTAGSGRFLFICTSYPLWGKPNPSDLESTFSRPLKSNIRLKQNLMASAAGKTPRNSSFARNHERLQQVQLDSARRRFEQSPVAIALATKSNNNSHRQLIHPDISIGGASTATASAPPASRQQTDVPEHFTTPKPNNASGSLPTLPDLPYSSNNNPRGKSASLRRHHSRSKIQAGNVDDSSAHIPRSMQDDNTKSDRLEA